MNASAIGRAYVGISGWRYPPWRGTFYPPGLAQRLELEYAAGRMSSVEINGSFYALQRPENYRRWYTETPADHCFAVKGGRFITHMKKLRDVEVPLANFFASGVLGLEDKLGPLLWQLPPNLGFDASRLSDFFDLLPRTTRQAAKLAEGHDERLAGRSLTTTDEDRPLRHAVEIRHESYRVPAFLELLREREIAIVVADTAGKWPLIEAVTTDFAYVRLHGDQELYVSGYSAAALDKWASLLHVWRTGADGPDRQPRDVFVYFDNDAKVHAPYNAMDLRSRLDRLAEG